MARKTGMKHGTVKIKKPKACSSDEGPVFTMVKTNAMRIVDADLVAMVVTSFTKTCEVYF